MRRSHLADHLRILPGLGRGLALIASKGKWATAWTGRGSSGLPPHSDASTCAAHVADTIKLGQQENRTFQFMYPGKNKDRTVFMNSLAYFLLVRGASAQFQFSVLGCYDTGLSYMPAWQPELEKDYGVPQGVATVANNVFTRQWSKTTVTLDCNDFSGTFTPK